MYSIFTPLLLTVVITATQGNPIPCDGCHCCDAGLITKTTSGAGAHSFDSDVVTTDGQCSVRTFKCKGTDANIEINNDGVISDPAEATLVVSCNAAGTAWEAEAMTVVKVECASL